MHGPRAAGADATEGLRPHDQVPRIGVGGGRRDEPVRAKRAHPGAESLRRVPRTHQVAEVHPERVANLGPPQVHDPQVLGTDAPQPPTLLARVDGAARRRRPLRPDGGGFERRVQRPRFARAVVPALADRRAVRWEDRRVDAGLTVGASREGGEELGPGRQT